MVERVAASLVEDPARVWALRECGLTSAADASVDRFAARVLAQLRVPVALVSLVEADRQVFPGMRGLPGPWGRLRSTPLSRSFCKHVVVTAEPVVVTDSRLDPGCWTTSRAGTST